MKINEFTDPLRTYIVTVRVVLKNSTTTVRTTIRAESANHAYIMLTRLYGVGNVQSVSEIVTETARTCQIQRQASFSCPDIQSITQAEKTGPAQDSLVDEAGTGRRRRQLSAQPTPMPIKREMMRRLLTRQLIKKSNIIKPNEDDLRVAHDRAEIALKRADLDYQQTSHRLT